MSTTRSTLRDRFNEFVQNHEVAWELAMAALAAAFVAVGFASEEDSPSGSLAIADAALTGIFVAEFGVRFAAARDHLAYLRGHWIDLVALVPTIRGFRLLRLLRLLRLVRAFAGTYRALARLERLARHRSLIGLFMAWLGVAVISATALYLAEAGVNPAVDDPGDALWWGITTLTTVGYGDIFPVTPEGRLAGAALMILGITLFATITGTITSLLVSERSARSDLPAQLVLLADLRERGVLTDAEFAAIKARILAGP